MRPQPISSAVSPHVLEGAPGARGLSHHADTIHAFLDLAGPIRDEHVLVTGPGALEVMCALNGRGAMSVLSLQAGCRTRAMTDVVLAPNVLSVEAAEVAILRARWARRATGSLFLRFAPGARQDLVEAAMACLVRHGFDAGQPRWLGGRAVLVSCYGACTAAARQSS